MARTYSDDVDDDLSPTSAPARLPTHTEEPLAPQCCRASIVTRVADCAYPDTAVVQKVACCEVLVG